MGGVIHVGAWDGSEYVGDTRRLLLIEPQADAFAQLQANCPHAELVNAACGSGPGAATMHTAYPSHSSSLLPCNGSVFAGTETVRVTTLDAVLADRGGFETLRIDTQGYELEVLKGAALALRMVEQVELEVHDPGTYQGAATLHDLDEHLVAHGFVRVTPDGVLDEVIYKKDRHG